MQWVKNVELRNSDENSDASGKAPRFEDSPRELCLPSAQLPRATISPNGRCCQKSRNLALGLTPIYTYLHRSRPCGTAIVTERPATALPAATPHHAATTTPHAHRQDGNKNGASRGVPGPAFAPATAAAAAAAASITDRTNEGTRGGRAPNHPAANWKPSVRGSIPWWRREGKERQEETQDTHRAYVAPHPHIFHAHHLMYTPPPKTPPPQHTQRRHRRGPRHHDAPPRARPVADGPEANRPRARGIPRVPPPGPRAGAPPPRPVFLLALLLSHSLDEHGPLRPAPAPRGGRGARGRARPPRGALRRRGAPPAGGGRGAGMRTGVYVYMCIHVYICVPHGSNWLV